MSGHLAITDANGVTTLIPEAELVWLRSAKDGTETIVHGERELFQRSAAGFWSWNCAPDDVWLWMGGEEDPYLQSDVISAGQRMARLVDDVVKNNQLAAARAAEAAAAVPPLLEAPTKTATLEDLWGGVPRVDRDGRALTDWHAEVITTLCRCLHTAPYRGQLAFKAQEAHPGYYAVSTTIDMGTTDRDELTRLVLAAHERCWRISLAPHGPRRLLIEVHQRQPRVAPIDSMRQHPTLEQAIASWRR
jgi:hypothetical protein